MRAINGTVKIIGLAILAYGFSCIAILAGYTPVTDVFDEFYWTFYVARALEEIPVYRVAGINTAASFAILFVSFWTSCGQINRYHVDLLGLSYITPFIVQIVFLPGAQSKPTWASSDFYYTIGIFFLINYLVVRSLRDWFWQNGGRD